MNESLLRAWWSHRQGLDGSMSSATPEEVLARTGWARSVAGVGPYLTLFSRAAIGRQAADDAVAAASIHELPTARGCTYVLPAADFALGLKLGQPFREPEMNTARKLGVTDKEIQKLSEAILPALKSGPLDPDGIRAIVGSAVRSLGEEGKKKGVTTTLPLALGRLQAEGEIRRIPVNGRLDQQRYKYMRWSPNPFKSLKLTYEHCLTELARKYFSWIAPATLANFQEFAGISQKAAKAALEPLNLIPLESGSQMLISKDALAQLQAFKIPAKPQYKLVSSLDSIALLRRDLKSLLKPVDLERVVPVEKGERALGGLAEFPSHTILDRGRGIGLWEFDTATSAIVWISFIKTTPALKAAVAETEAFIRDQVGDARSFSLDSPKSREPKISALRAMSS